jgi:hypothetical protein
MAQAERITTAIRELMSRGRRQKSTGPVRAAHTELIAALAGNPPNPIYRDVNSDDFDARVDHLEQMFAAIHVYLTAVIADTAQYIPDAALDRRYLDSLFQDLSADAANVVRNAAEEIREHEIWRAL